MPQARSGGSRSSRSSSTKKRSTTSRAKSSGSASASRSTRGRASSTRAKRTTSTSRRRSTAKPADARLEAAAQRLRKLNERIIDASRDAGEATLTSYERALKAIASTIERGPGSSDVEWVSQLATAQAKFIRDLTETWAKRARKALK